MKPGTFTKLYVHYVFSPKGRSSLLHENANEIIQKYIYGILKEKKCYPVAINGMPDHLHVLTGLNPLISVTSLITDIKRSSSLFINANNILPSRFSWQEGYGGFTVGYRELDKVYNYVLNQKEHHRNMNFRNEYLQIIDEYGFEEKNYLFEFYDEL